MMTFKAVADIKGTVNNIEVTIEDIQVIATTVSQAVSAIEDKIEALGTHSIDVHLTPGDVVVFLGEGCDQVDNIAFVDECEEDILLLLPWMIQFPTVLKVYQRQMNGFVETSL